MVASDGDNAAQVSIPYAANASLKPVPISAIGIISTNEELSQWLENTINSSDDDTWSYKMIVTFLGWAS